MRAVCGRILVGHCHTRRVALAIIVGSVLPATLRADDDPVPPALRVATDSQLPGPRQPNMSTPQPGDNIAAMYGGFRSSQGAFAGETLQPAEGQTIFARYVLFTFDPIAGADGYQLQVVIDSGEPDPFVTIPVVDVNLGWARKIVREGLAFGHSYAWRVRDLDGEDNWSPTHRFEIAVLPHALQSFADVTLHEPDNYQPGLTLLPTRVSTGSAYAVAIESNGDVVWFWQNSLRVTRLLRNGNLLYTGGNQGGEVSLTGEPLWNSGSLAIDFHEIYEMPNGNIILLVHDAQVVQTENGPQNWFAQVITEVTREGDIVWTWSPFDHISTLDFDACFMQSPGQFGYDWIHGNAVVYDAREDVMYYNSRHLSRIIKIDYGTGDIIWNLGFDMPSGDVNFGDDLFSMQHAVEILENGNLLMFDNGNRRGHSFCLPPQPYSTAVELAVNPGEPEPVEEVWRHTLDLFAPFVGDADRLPNGNTLITAGAVQRVFEVAEDGSLVWEYEQYDSNLIYRADRIPTLYPLRGDADSDDDVDVSDFADFQQCFSGPNGTSIYHTCLAHDFDNDGDVDILDFEQFSQAFTGPGS